MNEEKSIGICIDKAYMAKEITNEDLFTCFKKGQRNGNWQKHYPENAQWHIHAG